MLNHYYRLSKVISDHSKENILITLKNPKIFYYSESDEEDIIKYRKDIIEGNTQSWDNMKVLSNPMVTLEMVDIMVNNYNISDRAFKVLLKNSLGVPEYKYWRMMKEFSHHKNYLIREELLAKSWDPSRFKEWCLSTEENQELKERW